jgi:prolyl-tRNA synthetase
MMGGKVAHEFMLLTPIGEDSIVTCGNCTYSANLEAAKSIVKNENVNFIEPLKKVHTPETKTIDDVCSYLKLPIEQSCKAVVYQKTETNEYVVVFIRGDLDVNEVKVRNHLLSEIYPAIIDEKSNLCAGFLGPHKLENITILFDESLHGISSFCCGANDSDYHYTGFNIERDYGNVIFYDLAKARNDGICPQCYHSSLKISRGIELGNIFQLGDKYTKAMNMSYTDDNGVILHPIMGCYGIGVERLAASVCESKHDDDGPIWTMSIAPWQVHLCCVRADNKDVKTIADKLYEQMQNAGIEVIYDDRVVSAGVMFSDADLLGIPIRVVVSPRNLKNNCCEITTRDKKLRQESSLSDVLLSVQKLITELSS